MKSIKTALVSVLFFCFCFNINCSFASDDVHDLLEKFTSVGKDINEILQEFHGRLYLEILNKRMDVDKKNLKDLEQLLALKKLDILEDMFRDVSMIYLETSGYYYQVGILTSLAKNNTNKENENLKDYLNETIFKYEKLYLILFEHQEAFDFMSLFSSDS